MRIRIRFLSILLIVALIAPMAFAQNKSAKEDDRIYDEVRRKLAADADVNGAAFEVTVKNGAVTLRGRVHTNKGKEKAEKIARKVKGVTSVDNQLKLFTEE